MSDDEEVQIEDIYKAIASAAPLKSEDTLIDSGSMQVKGIRNSAVDLSVGIKDSINQTIAKDLIQH
jgi:hypothetical protein